MTAVATAFCCIFLPILYIYISGSSHGFLTLVIQPNGVGLASFLSFFHLKRICLIKSCWVYPFNCCLGNTCVHCWSSCNRASYYYSYCIAIILAELAQGRGFPVVVVVVVCVCVCVSFGVLGVGVFCLFV